MENQTRKADILKSGGIIIQNRKMLFVREHADIFLTVPGGTIKHGEEPLACLKRELKEEIGITNLSIDSSPFYTTPLVPAATQPDKMLQIIAYFVTLHEEPKPTYNAEKPILDEDIEELYWVGGEDLFLIQKDANSFKVKYKENIQGVASTIVSEEYILPKLIELNLIDKPT